MAYLVSKASKLLQALLPVISVNPSICSKRNTRIQVIEDIVPFLSATCRTVKSRSSMIKTY